VNNTMISKQAGIKGLEGTLEQLQTKDTSGMGGGAKAALTKEIKKVEAQIAAAKVDLQQYAEKVVASTPVDYTERAKEYVGEIIDEQVKDRKENLERLMRNIARNMEWVAERLYTADHKMQIMYRHFLRWLVADENDEQAAQEYMATGKVQYRQDLKAQDFVEAVGKLKAVAQEELMRTIGGGHSSNQQANLCKLWDQMIWKDMCDGSSFRMHLISLLVEMEKEAAEERKMAEEFLAK